MIVVRIYEGLGNQMFEYAYAYALSERLKKRGIAVYLDIRNEAVTAFDEIRLGRPLLLEQFNIKLPVATSKMLNHWEYLSEKKIIHKAIYNLSEKRLWRYKFFKENEFNYKKEHIKIADNTYIEGWFQHYQYFERYRSELLKQFTLKNDWKVPVIVEQILREYQVISIHIRRGDYVTNPIVRRSMAICGRDYYLKAIDYLKSKLSNPYIFVFTNDQTWVEQNLELDIPYIVVSNRYMLSDIQEMMLMSKCNHNIIANSTFSWWGAWLNVHTDKIVIAPKKWFLDRERKNIAMKSWITM